MTELLLTIGKWSWFIEFVAMCFFVLFAIQDKKPGSALMTLLIVVVLGGVMRQYAANLYAINEPEYKLMVRFAWYMGFTAIYAAGMFILHKIHVAFSLQLSLIARTVLYGYVLGGQLQLLRYGERVLFSTDYLQPIYQAGIPSINIVIAITALSFAMVITVSRIRVKLGKSGVTWTI